MDFSRDFDKEAGHFKIKKSQSFSHQEQGFQEIIRKYGRINKVTAGERIMQLRLDRRYTREQLAYLANISEKFLYEIEMDKKGFSAITLMNLAKALEVSMDYIMLGKSGRKYDNEIVATLERFKPNTLGAVEKLLEIAYEISMG